MGDVLFLILRRLRAPLITLIAVYAVLVGGLTLIPAVDADGNPGHMSIFHAFYVMSYTATTIGFGEVPQAFNDAQRLWVTFAIYLSVTGWAYTLGTVIALVNDATFRDTLARGVFIWRVRGIAEPFYILCGYGQSGSRLGNRWTGSAAAVIVELRLERIARVAIQDDAHHRSPSLRTRASPTCSKICGIDSPDCQGLIALAGEDSINQAIAIGARLLNPAIQIVARAKSCVAEGNWNRSVVEVINLFDTFAFNLGVSLRNPEILQIEEWLTATRVRRAPSASSPRAGRGAFGMVDSGARSPKFSIARESSGKRSIRRSMTILTGTCSMGSTPRASCATPASLGPTCWSPGRTSTRSIWG